MYLGVGNNSEESRTLEVCKYSYQTLEKRCLTQIPCLFPSNIFCDSRKTLLLPENKQRNTHHKKRVIFSSRWRTPQCCGLGWGGVGCDYELTGSGCRSRLYMLMSDLALEVNCKVYLDICIWEMPYILLQIITITMFMNDIFNSKTKMTI